MDVALSTELELCSSSPVPPWHYFNQRLCLSSGLAPPAPFCHRIYVIWTEPDSTRLRSIKYREFLYVIDPRRTLVSGVPRTPSPYLVPGPPRHSPPS